VCAGSNPAGGALLGALSPPVHMGSDHRIELPLVIALDAVRIDPQQDLHRVSGPFGDQRCRGPGIQPPGDSGMPES
jgi:hypothetical protein